MAEITRRRGGEMLRALFKILLPHPEGLQAKDAIEAVGDELELTPFELSTYPNLPEVQRYRKILRFHTITCVKSGWLVKQKGVWKLTDAGRAAFETIKDPEAFMRASIAGYKEWRKTHPKEDKKHLDPLSPRVWVFRAGHGGEFADLFERKGLIAMGFAGSTGTPDIGGMTREEIAELIANVFPETTKQARAIYVGQLFRFANELKEDDFVITPVKRGKELLIGEVIGEYRWSETPVVANYRHIRNVQWLARVPRDRIRSESIKKLGSMVTLSQPDHQDYFLQFIAGMEDIDDGRSPDVSGKDLKSLAEVLFVPVKFLETVISLLKERKQIIFYGPPGTGKTFIARELARHLAPDGNEREVVQFHPNYSYEDFVLGYRPETNHGVLSYELRPGPLVRLAERARRSDKPHVLLIDEINRGNLPKILGELLFLLEYRNESVGLMYGNEQFSLPSNLLIIGTMNTADRSIALVDAALRRRFHFVPLFPNEYPIDEVLQRWLADNKPDMLWVTDIVDRLNGLLTERFGRHLQVGHSYFINTNLDEVMLERIWEYDVMPFLEDQLFGQEKELDNFSLDRLRELVQPHVEDDSFEGVETTDTSSIEA